MLPAFKETVEELFVRGLVRAVFATETLALGINMPARTVVLERLVKFNGESARRADPRRVHPAHRAGRAPRHRRRGPRGGDLAARRRPRAGRRAGLDPHVPAAQLVPARLQHGRQPGRPARRRSGPRAARAVVRPVPGRPLGRRAGPADRAQRRDPRGLRGLDALPPRRLRRVRRAAPPGRPSGRRRWRRQGIADSRDAAADALRSAQARRRHRGAGRAARRAWPWSSTPGSTGDDDPRPLVLTEDRWAGRLSAADFPDPGRGAGPDAAAQARRPPGARACAATSRRRCANTGIVAPDAGAAAGTAPADRPPRTPSSPTLRRALRAHPCHGCDDREAHARWAERHARLERETEQLRQKVARHHPLAGPRVRPDPRAARRARLPRRRDDVTAARASGWPGCGASPTCSPPNACATASGTAWSPPSWPPSCPRWSTSRAATSGRCRGCPRAPVVGGAGRHRAACGPSWRPTSGGTGSTAPASPTSGSPGRCTGGRAASRWRRCSRPPSRTAPSSPRATSSAGAGRCVDLLDQVADVAGRAPRSGRPRRRRRGRCGAASWRPARSERARAGVLRPSGTTGTGRQAHDPPCPGRIACAGDGRGVLGSRRIGRRGGDAGERAQPSVTAVAARLTLAPRAEPQRSAGSAAAAAQQYGQQLRRSRSMPHEADPQQECGSRHGPPPSGTAPAARRTSRPAQWGHAPPAGGWGGDPEPGRGGGYGDEPQYGWQADRTSRREPEQSRPAPGCRPGSAAGGGCSSRSSPRSSSCVVVVLGFVTPGFFVTKVFDAGARAGGRGEGPRRGLRDSTTSRTSAARRTCRSPRARRSPATPRRRRPRHGPVTVTDERGRLRGRAGRPERAPGPPARRRRAARRARPVRRRAATARRSTTTGGRAPAPAYAPGRTFGAFDPDGRLVGTATSFPSRIAVPGGAVLDAAAVTQVGVRADHTRRGLLTALMRAQLDDLRARGDVLAPLHATEARIYGRFGYGVATRARSRPGPAQRRGAAAAGARGRDGAAAGPGRDRPRPVAPCTTRSPCAARAGSPAARAWWRSPADAPRRRQRLLAAVHTGPDGRRRLRRGRRAASPARSGRTARVRCTSRTCTPPTPPPRPALWRFLLGVDLIGEVTRGRAARRAAGPAARRPARRRRHRRRADELWLRLVDVPAALAARAFADAAPVLLGVHDPLLEDNAGSTGSRGQRASASSPLGGPVSRSCRATSPRSRWPTSATAARPSSPPPAGGPCTTRPRSARADAAFATTPVPWCGTTSDHPCSPPPRARRSSLGRLPTPAVPAHRSTCAIANAAGASVPPASASTSRSTEPPSPHRSASSASLAGSAGAAGTGRAGRAARARPRATRTTGSTTAR